MILRPCLRGTPPANHLACHRPRAGRRPVRALVRRSGTAKSPADAPDGTILTLVQVDYGKTNTLWEGTRFEKMFRRFIPAKGINLPGIRIQPPNATETLIHSNDTLVFWILHTGTKKWNTAPMYQRAIAFDENGNELENLAGAMGLISGTNVYSRWEIQAFPRNGKNRWIAYFGRYRGGHAAASGGVCNEKSHAWSPQGLEDNPAAADQQSGICGVRNDRS